MDQEVWYEIEVTHKDDNDWNRLGTKTYDSVAAAQTMVDANAITSHYWKYQIVKVTTTREVVS